MNKSNTRSSQERKIDHQPLILFWAKLGRETWPEKYHPVLCHLIDVGQVARALWDRALRERVHEWVAAKLDPADTSAVGKWLAFWSAAHDIGKISPCFQSQGNSETLREMLGQSWFDSLGYLNHHGEIGTKILAEELKSPDQPWPAVSANMARNIAVAVGGHHGVFPANWLDIYAPLGNDRWTAARREILAELARLFGVSELPPPSPTATDDQSIWMFLAGLTSVADWIGSNKTFFTEYGNAERVNETFDSDGYFRWAGERAIKALKELGWLDREETTACVTFAELFPDIKRPRPLQTVVAEISSRMTEPCLVIVEAPMGEGKTEAAWYTAACWDRKRGQGAYVALPTMATSNQMFDRVGKFLEHDAGMKNLMLLHGKAALNDRFAHLRYAAQVFDDEQQPSAVVAEGWFAANKKHGLLAPYGVGTIDQALLAVLQTRHVFVRLFGLAGKCVILDEVHAYDAYMTTLMERLLRWLAALGCPVVLLSATLPREKRLKLLRAYAGEDVAEPEHVEYPRITCIAVGGPATAKHLAADKDRARTVQLGWLKEENLSDQVRVSLANGGCAAVIRNTVGLAQNTYCQLRDALRDDGIRVELFHARFPFGRRSQIEEEVLNWYGRTRADMVDDHGRIVSAPRRPAKSVLVATQIIEQSLDLDFDVMVTDVAPVDLVLQRVGRLHRHDRGPRPAGISEPRLWLIEPENKNGLPDFGRSEYVYARFILLRSLAALRAVDPAVVELPGHLETLVEEVYGEELLMIPEPWRAVLEEAERELGDEQKTQRTKAKSLLIYRPDDEDLLRQQNAQLFDEDDPAVAETIRAATRDTEPTIRLILLYNVEDRDYLDASGREPFNEAEEPDINRVRRLLDNEVVINHRGCVSFYAHRPVPTGWRDRGILRYNRVVRIDGSGTSLPAEYPMHFDPRIGVRFSRGPEERGSP